MSVMVTRAYHFAAQRHVDHRRKGAAAEPYINHLCEVAALVAQATDGGDEALIAAAVLHDTIEDTETTADELALLFGADVAALVLEVTDDKTHNRAQRKQAQIDKAPTKSPRAALLKMADKTSNLRALVASPPDGWPDARRLDYVAWSRAVIRGLACDNAWLHGQCEDAARRVEADASGP